MNQEDVIAMHNTRMEIKKRESGSLQNEKYSKTRVKDALGYKCWIDGNGDYVLIKDMSTLHINNCVQFLIKGTYTQSSLHVIKIPKQLEKARSKYLKLFEDEINTRSKEKNAGTN